MDNKKKWSVAIRPTEAEVMQHALHYDKPYYEDRAEVITASNADAAVKKYIEMNICSADISGTCFKKGDRLWMTAFEERFVRASEVSPK